MMGFAGAIKRRSNKGKKTQIQNEQEDFTGKSKTMLLPTVLPQRSKRTNCQRYHRHCNQGDCSDQERKKSG